jgi:hypothetical protein
MLDPTTSTARFFPGTLNELNLIGPVELLDQRSSVRVCGGPPYAKVPGSSIENTPLFRHSPNDFLHCTVTSWRLSRTRRRAIQICSPRAESRKIGRSR